MKSDPIVRALEKEMRLLQRKHKELKELLDGDYHTQLIYNYIDFMDVFNSNMPDKQKLKRYEKHASEEKRLRALAEKQHKLMLGDGFRRLFQLENDISEINNVIFMREMRRGA